MQETAKELMIEAAGVQKVYDAGGLRVRALRGVDLGIRRGEMVAIMGPSGCGKTTLLNVLSGLDDLSDGEVYVDGESIKGMSDRKRTRFRAEKMGFIFQSYNLIPVLSAVENVELPLLVAGHRPKKAEAVGAGRPGDGRARGAGEEAPGRDERRPAAAHNGRPLAGQQLPPSSGPTSRPAPSTPRRPGESWTSWSG